MLSQKEKIKVLFLCTGNSCRSQMAEGWARHLHGDLIEAYSAGTAAQGLNSNAVKVMREAGVDISGHQSKTVSDLVGCKFDYVVTVCENAQTNCPVFPGNATIIHKSFDDPPALAEADSCEHEVLFHYRRVCTEVKEWVEGLPKFLCKPGKVTYCQDSLAARHGERSEGA